MNQPIPPFEQLVKRLVHYAFSRIAQEGERRGLTQDEVATLLKQEVDTYLPAPKKSIWRLGR